MMRITRITPLIGLLAALFLLEGCATPSPLNEVIVIGTIHDKHLVSERYSVDVLRDMFRRVHPDVVLCEIPPDRLKPALEQWRAKHVVTDDRVSQFPEYTQMLFPLTQYEDFTIVPCSAWTQQMEDGRKARLKFLEEARPVDCDKAQEAMDWAARKLSAEGMADDPAEIHTDHYDRIVRVGMAPYNHLFADKLDAGSWSDVNAAHYKLIDEALNERSGRGLRIVIMFGAWNKYWFLEQLRQRDDIVLRSPMEFMPETKASSQSAVVGD